VFSMGKTRDGNYTWKPKFIPAKGPHTGHGTPFPSARGLTGVYVCRYTGTVTPQTEMTWMMPKDENPVDALNEKIRRARQ